MNGYAGYLIERRKLLQVEPTHYALYLCFRDNVAKISHNLGLGETTFSLKNNFDDFVRLIEFWPLH